jgi:hypothetical protein
MSNPPTAGIPHRQNPMDLVFVPDPKSKTTSLANPQSSKTNIAFESARRYAFILGNDSKSRHTVQKSVQFDYQHKKRTLAAWGPGPDPRKVLGWRRAPIAPKPVPIFIDETPGLNSSSEDSSATPNAGGIKFKTFLTRVSAETRDIEDPQGPNHKRGKNLPNRISLCPYCLGAVFVDKGIFRAERLVNCPQCRRTGFFGIRHTTEDGRVDSEHPNVSPSSPLGAGQVDPFDIYPVALRQSDRKLVVHCKNAPANHASSRTDTKSQMSHTSPTCSTNSPQPQNAIPVE